MINKVKVIAEVKVKSPFGFRSPYNWDELFDLANKIGDIISIHTDPIKTIEAGADFVLVVGRIPGVYKDKCLIEPLNLKELETIPNNFKIVWNSRDLSDGSLKQETFEQARKKWAEWICQASNIKNIRDIKVGANAILIGSYLKEFAKSLK